MALEDAAEHEVAERAVRPPGDLEQEHDVVDRCVAERRHGAARVVVHRHAELLAHRPDRLVGRGVEGRQARAGRRAGEQHPAGQPGAARPADLVDRGVDVAEQDLRDAGASPRRRRAEVDEPPVVGAQAGPAQLELAGVRGRRARRERGLREEGRHGVGEQHLGDDAVGLGLGEASVAVPVAARVRSHEVGVGHLVVGGPRVEVVEVAPLEVVAVGEHLVARVAVGRHDDVAVLGRHRRLPCQNLGSVTLFV